MYSVGLDLWEWLPFLAVFIWLLSLTYFIWKQSDVLSHFFNELPDRDLKKKLKDLLQLDKKISDLENEGRLHLQKIGLIRYNPFNDTGGDMSFSLCILDEKGDGVVLSSLHSRAETRTFAKSIRSGKSEQHTLSKEEEEALSRALKS